MDAHRRMAHRRQAFSGDPFDSTGGLVSKTSSDPVATGTSQSTINQQSSTSSSTSTSSTSTSTSSSTSSSLSSSSSSSSSSLVSQTSTSTLVRSTQSSRSTSFSRPALTSLSSKPTSTGTSGNASSGATISTGAVVGGIAAGILGIAGIIFAVLYFIRRLKKRKDDTTFDSDIFKRQSRLLHDEPQILPDNDNNSPFAPRPPTMIERRMNSTPVSNMGGSAQGPGPAYGGYNDYNAGYDHSGFTPGQVIPHPYGDPYMGSPMTAPMSPPMSVNYGDVGAGQSQSAYLSRQPPTNGPAPADNNGQYVDMSRSSVTPFQAAQYEEIHRRLNMPAPGPVLGSLAEEEYPREGPAPKGPSPFADSSEDVIPPPSPAHSNPGRIDSTPPTLPELNPPMSPVYALRPGTAELSSKRTESSTANLPAAPALAHVIRPNPATQGQKRPDTVYTIYDDEDAYGGI